MKKKNENNLLTINEVKGLIKYSPLGLDIIFFKDFFDGVFNAYFFIEVC